MKAAPQPLSPSSLYQIDSKTELIDGQENLTAVADSNILRRMCDYFSSDHPIPLHLQTFYYEIKNLSEGRHILYLHINATDLVHTNSSFPVWASMDQWKVLVRQARRQFFGLTLRTGSNGTRNPIHFVVIVILTEKTILSAAASICKLERFSSPKTE